MKRDCDTCDTNTGQQVQHRAAQDVRHVQALHRALLTLVESISARSAFSRAPSWPQIAFGRKRQRQSQLVSRSREPFPPRRRTVAGSELEVRAMFDRYDV